MTNDGDRTAHLEGHKGLELARLARAGAWGVRDRLRRSGITWIPGRPDLVRIGPVHFQTLEQELAPVTHYLTGHVLNAGAGARDIGPYLRRAGATQVTRYDLESSDPEVVIGPLEDIAFPDATFDSVLCNAVLEHVTDVDQAIHELARVVRPGGNLVVAIPFLQPYHACPGDYRRYTADGLAALGRSAGLEVVGILPVHSIAQTLGWILWEWALEKGGRLRKCGGLVIRLRGDARVPSHRLRADPQRQHVPGGLPSPRARDARAGDG